MNGMILYPTDDEIVALREAVLYTEQIGILDDSSYIPFKGLVPEDMIPIWFAYSLIMGMFRFFINDKPLKINETVLG